MPTYIPIMNYGRGTARQSLKHPALNPAGKRAKLLARGSFALVYQHPTKPERVLKVTADRFAYSAMCDGCYPLKKEWTPCVYANHGYIGWCNETQLAIYLVEVEKLKPLGTVTSEEVRQLKVYRKIVKEWSRNFGEDCVPDMHPANVMRRDGTDALVVSDPVCDGRMIREYKNRIFSDCF